MNCVAHGSGETGESDSQIKAALEAYFAHNHNQLTHETIS